MSFCRRVCGRTNPAGSGKATAAPRRRRNAASGMSASRIAASANGCSNSGTFSPADVDIQALDQRVAIFESVSVRAGQNVAAKAAAIARVQEIAQNLFRGTEAERSGFESRQQFRR